MACCGRPDNRAGKGGPASYYEKYAYLTGAQIAKQAELVGSKCTQCDALTSGDPCTICGKSKTQEEKEAE